MCAVKFGDRVLFGQYIYTSRIKEPIKDNKVFLERLSEQYSTMSDTTILKELELLYKGVSYPDDLYNDNEKSCLCNISVIPECDWKEDNCFNCNLDCRYNEATNCKNCDFLDNCRYIKRQILTNVYVTRHGGTLDDIVFLSFAPGMNISTNMGLEKLCEIREILEMYSKSSGIVIDNNFEAGQLYKSNYSQQYGIDYTSSELYKTAVSRLEKLRMNGSIPFYGVGLGLDWDDGNFSHLPLIVKDVCFQMKILAKMHEIVKRDGANQTIVCDLIVAAFWCNYINRAPSLKSAQAEFSEVEFNKGFYSTNVNKRIGKPQSRNNDLFSLLTKYNWDYQKAEKNIIDESYYRYILELKSIS